MKVIDGWACFGVGVIWTSCGINALTSGQFGKGAAFVALGILAGSLGGFVFGRGK